MSRTAPLIVLALGAASLSACAPAPDARWSGDGELPDTAVRVDRYEAMPGLPDLTAPQAVRAAGLTGATTSTPTHARGEGWSVSVEQGPFGTRLMMGRECGTPETDASTVIAAAEGLYERLGGASGDQSWFTVPEQGADRVFAEPILDGVQTWSTGFVVTRVDEGGVCSFSGTLMAFRNTGTPTTFISAKDAFVHAEEGTYDSVEQTYTLGATGRLVPAWRFAGDEGAVMVVDLGDGLESAPDSETYLSAAAQAPDATPPSSSAPTPGP